MQIKEEEMKEHEKENEIRTKFARLDELEMQMAATQEQAATNKSAAVLMSDLISAGIVKQTNQNSFVV